MGIKPTDKKHLQTKVQRMENSKANVSCCFVDEDCEDVFTDYFKLLKLF